MSKELTSLVARLLLSAIFLRSLWAKLANFDGSLGLMTSKGLPGGWVGAVLLGCAIATLAGASLAVLTGWKARVGAWVLFAYLIPVTLIFHGDVSARGEWIHLTKNLSIMGGLLLLATHGPGRYAAGRG